MPAATTDRPVLTLAPYATQPPLPLDDLPPAAPTPVYRMVAHGPHGGPSAALSILPNASGGYTVAYGLSYDAPAGAPPRPVIGRAMIAPTFAAALAAASFGRMMLEGAAQSYAAEVGPVATWTTTAQTRMPAAFRTAAARAGRAARLVPFRPPSRAVAV